MEINFTDEPVAVVLPPKRSKLKALIMRMGLGAFTISLMVHVIFAIIAIFFMYKWVYPPQEKVDFIPGGGSSAGSKGNEVSQAVKTKQAKKMMSSALNKRITSSATNAAFVLPDAQEQTIDAQLPADLASTGAKGNNGKGPPGAGTGPNLGPSTGPGMGKGEFGIAAMIPTLMKGRCTEAARLKMIAEAGGTKEVEIAVQKSLQWLKGRQNADGSWGKSHPVGMTGLVVLCYLGHCEGTTSKDYGENVTRALAYLLNTSMKNQGKLATAYTGIAYSYEHAIATYALAEALTFSRSLTFKPPGLEVAVEQAVQIIIKGQTTAGGWDYSYTRGSRNDLSVSGWQMQALKAAKLSGVKADGLQDSIKLAVKQIEKMYMEDGKFSYENNNGAKPAMTGVGALCLQQWGTGSGGKPVREAVKLIRQGLEQRGKENRDPKPDDFRPNYRLEYNGPYADPYGWYYAAQVMRNAGGKNWELMSAALIAEIIPAQTADGSFKLEMGGGPLSEGQGTGTAGTSRDIYVQALDTLMLEVYFRFLPTSAGGAGHNVGLE
jgi:hypothetical protein